MLRAAGSLFPGRWRMVAGVVAGLSVLGVALLAWRYHGEQGPGRLDLAVYGQLAGLGQHQPLLWRVSLLGTPLMLVVGTLVLATLAARTRRRSAVLLALIGPILAVLVTEFVLKPATGRLLDGELSLPSGHTTSIAALASVAVVLCVAGGRDLSWRTRAALGLSTVIAVASVAVSMIATYRHYATDTVAGALVAVAVVALLGLALDATVSRRQAAPTPPATSG